MFNRCLTDVEHSRRRSLKCEGWFATCSRRIAALLENFEPSDMVNSLLHEWVGRLSVTGKTQIGLLLEKNKKLVFLLDTPPGADPLSLCPLSLPVAASTWRLHGLRRGLHGSERQIRRGTAVPGPMARTLHRRKAGIQTTHDSSSTFVAH